MNKEHRLLFKTVQAVIVFLFLCLGTLEGQTYIMSNTTITTCSGTFLDPGGSSDYPVGNTSTMVIAPAAAGQYVTVNFTSFNVQQYWDLLYVYDGNSVAAPLIGIYSGTVSPGLLRASTTNASRSLTFHFVSNWWAGGAEPGWSATIACSATGGPPVYSMKNGGSYTVCSGTFYDSGGPTHTYNWNENSVMTFCPSSVGQGIQLAFGPIDLEQDGDLLHIYDGPSTASPLIGGFGNSDNVVLPAQTFTASTANSSGCLTASFVSDGWWQNPGWAAAISCVPKTSPVYAISDNTITTCTGTFTDNGGGNAPYMNFSDDVFTICSDNASNPYITLNFTGLDLWTNFDFLRVYDGTSTAAPLIATYTGISGPFTVSSGTVSGCLTFRFTSDGWTQRFGWNATIGCTNVIALPVEWLSFTGERSDLGVDLEWVTATETNSWYYEVQRYNGIGFDSIGYVPAAGNSSHTLYYDFTDSRPNDGWSYYRLKQVDLNGDYAYSSIVAIPPSSGNGEVLVQYQDPGSQDMLLFRNMQKGIFELKIFSANAGLVSRQSVSVEDRYHIMPLNMGDYSAGSYFIQISNGSDFTTVLPYIKR